MSSMTVYDEAHQRSPPVDHIRAIAQSEAQPPKLAKPEFGLDSLFGLLMSSIAAPLYLYASLRGKFSVWEDILAELPDDVFRAPTLDVGCGRGMVLLKMAQRKRQIASAAAVAVTATELGPGAEPAYGIDIFSTADQTGNAPAATYQNAEAMHVVPYAVLHTASFAERFPFADGAFALITSSLAIHNADADGRLNAVREMARVCRPGGRIVIVDLLGYVKHHRAVLRALGWTKVDVSMVGFCMMFGCLPCQVLMAEKPY